MKAGHGRRVGRRLNARKGKISQAMFDMICRSIIVFLCIYILGHCMTLFLGDNAKKELVTQGGKFVSRMVEFTIKNTEKIFDEVINRKENKKELANVIKDNVLRNDMEKYMEKQSDSIEDIKEMEELIREVEAENVAYVISTSTTETTVLVKDETKDEKEAVQTLAKNTIVPKPKLAGKKYNAAKLKNFENTIKKFYTVASATSIKSEDLNINKALDMNFSIEGKNDKPQILIYHTHSQEEFKDTGNSNKKTIIQVGDYLAKILREQFGYNVLHDTSTYDLVNGSLDRNKAYEQSREGVSKILKENPSINLILDIHRDGVGDNVHLVTKVNGKQTAQIMFFNGVSRLKGIGDIDYLYNPYLKENLALSLQMKLNAEAYYPGFTRNNYINAYQYNLDLCQKAMLIEIGAQTNTFEEAKNAAEPLAMLIHMTMGKDS